MEHIIQGHVPNRMFALIIFEIVRSTGTAARSEKGALIEGFALLPSIIREAVIRLSNNSTQ